MGLLKFEWENGEQRSPSATPLLSVRNISVRLGQRLVLDDISLDAYEGEHIRITGPNGAGKSTLLNAISGVIPLASGRILFQGDDISDLPIHERSRLGICYMAQRNNHFPSLTVSENLRLALGPGGYQFFAENFPDWARDIRPDQMANNLSGGQKQKLAWGMTALSRFSIFLCDEPEAGLSDHIFIEPDWTVLRISHKHQ